MSRAPEPFRQDRRALFRCATGARIRNWVGQIFIDGGEFLIIHGRHGICSLIWVGIDACAHGVDEVRKLPLLDKIEVGSERPELPGTPPVKSWLWHSRQS